MTIALYLVAAVASPAAAERFDANAQIDRAIAIIRPVAYRSRQVNWRALAREMRRRATGARDNVDMLPVWATLARGLGDRHSFIQPTDAAKAAWRARYGTKSYLPDTDPPHRLSSTFTKRTGIAQIALPVGQNHTAQLVTVTPVSGFGPEAKGYATKLFTAIADAPPRTCGYVVDLRGNTGGNVWPMLLGLSGLLGDGPQGISQDAKGKIEAYATLKQGSAVVLAEEGRGATMLALDAWRPIPALQHAPVALLVDDATASSGEGVAVAFAGRPATRTFGSRTYGVASSNEGFMLPDGTNVVVTTGMMMDRSHHTYPDGIVPDEAVGDAAGSLEAAQRWLATQQACQGQITPPAGGSGHTLGVAPNPDPSAPRLTRLSDADMSRLIKPDPSYRRGPNTAHAKVVGAFAIDESNTKVTSAWAFGFMPIILKLDNDRCYQFAADYVGGTLSNGRMTTADCNGRRPVQEAEPPAPPAGQALRYVGQSWSHAAWANDRTHTTIVTAPTRDAFKPLFTAKMDPVAMLATAGIDYPGGNVTLVGRVDGRLVILTLEVGY